MKVEQNPNTAVDVQAQRVVNRYVLQLQTMTILRQLIPLIIASQKHRGMSLASLEGDDTFIEATELLTLEIENRFKTLFLLKNNLSESFIEMGLERLYQEWQAMASWRGNSLEDFHLHSYFIEQLMQLVFRLSEKANFFLNAYRSSGFNSKSAVFGDELTLTQLILKDIPELIELIARLRGLATHAMVLKQCDDDHYLWIDQLIKELNQKKEKFRSLTVHLQKYSVQHIPALIDLQVHDVQMVQLSDYVRRLVLNAEFAEIKSNQFDSHVIFNMATKIIDSQNEVVYQGLEYIQGKIHRQFDAWHSLTS